VHWLADLTGTEYKENESSPKVNFNELKKGYNIII